MAKNTHLKARPNEITVSHSQVDTPLLDVNAIERFQSFRPDIVDFIIEETRKESESRRKNEARVNQYIFIEKLGGLFLAVFVACCGIFGSLYVAERGFEKLSWIIASACIGSLAVALLRRDK